MLIDPVGTPFQGAGTDEGVGASTERARERVPEAMRPEDPTGAATVATKLRPRAKWRPAEVRARTHESEVQAAEAETAAVAPMRIATLEPREVCERQEPSTVMEAELVAWWFVLKEDETVAKSAVTDLDNVPEREEWAVTTMCRAFRTAKDDFKVIVEEACQRAASDADLPAPAVAEASARTQLEPNTVTETDPLDGPFTATIALRTAESTERSLAPITAAERVPTCRTPPEVTARL